MDGGIQGSVIMVSVVLRVPLISGALESTFPN